MFYSSAEVDINVRLKILKRSQIWNMPVAVLSVLHLNIGSSLFCAANGITFFLVIIEERNILI